MMRLAVAGTKAARPLFAGETPAAAGAGREGAKAAQEAGCMDARPDVFLFRRRPYPCQSIIHARRPMALGRRPLSLPHDDPGRPVVRKKAIDILTL